MKIVLTILIVFVLSSTSVFAQLAGSGLKTDAYGEKFTIPDQDYLDFSGSFTVEIWVKFDVVAASQLDDACIVHKEEWSSSTGWLFEFNKVFGYLTFRINGAQFSKRVECSYSSIFDDLEWHHIAASYSSSTHDIILVVDGMEKASSNFGSTTINANALNVSVSSSFYGQVDNLRIWDSYRDETTIRNDMFIKLENPSSESNLIGCYRLDENGGTNCNDESASSNDGTTFGSVEWITSHAVIANKSHTGRGYSGVSTADLVENSNVPVDIIWYDGDPSSHPTIEASFAALQINQRQQLQQGFPSTMRLCSGIPGCVMHRLPGMNIYDFIMITWEESVMKQVSNSIIGLNPVMDGQKYQFIQLFQMMVVHLPLQMELGILKLI